MVIKAIMSKYVQEKTMIKLIDLPSPEPANNINWANR